MSIKKGERYMCTQKLINEISTLFNESKYYQDLMCIYSREQKETFIKEFINNVALNPPMYSDATMKHITDMIEGDLRNAEIVKDFITTYTGLRIESIDQLKNEVVRPNEYAKTCFMDNLYKINNDTYLDIEAQSELPDEQLMGKNTLYEATIFSQYSIKGEKNAAYYKKVILLCIYEDIYHGKWSQGTMEVIDDHIKVYTFMDPRYGFDGNVKLSMYIVELGKINDIVKRKGMNHLSKAEKYSYVIKNYHLAMYDPELEENIEMICRKEKVIKDMVDIRNDYLNDPLQQIMLAKDRIERMTERAIEREEQRQKYYNRVLKRFKMKYSEDPAFLEDLTLEAYEQIYEMIIDDASIDEIKNYVVSLK